MKELKDKYVGSDMLELARQFNAGFDDVSVFGFVRFLIDNGYQIEKYEIPDRDARRMGSEGAKNNWMKDALYSFSRWMEENNKLNASKDTAKFSGVSNGNPDTTDMFIGVIPDEEEE